MPNDSAQFSLDVSPARSMKCTLLLTAIALLTEIFQFVREYNAEIVTISTAIMALFTIALFISNYLLWKSGEKHSERELRAYVSIAGASIWNFGSSKQIKVNLSVQNSGQTPAYDLCLITTLDFHKLPRLDFAPVEKIDGLESKGALGPGTSLEAPREMPRALTPEICDRILRRESAIFFFGTINYRDAFETVHKFPFHR